MRTVQVSSTHLRGGAGLLSGLDTCEVLEFCSKKEVHARTYRSYVRCMSSALHFAC